MKTNYAHKETLGWFKSADDWPLAHRRRLYDSAWLIIGRVAACTFKCSPTVTGRAIDSFLICCPLVVRVPFYQLPLWWHGIVCWWLSHCCSALLWKPLFRQLKDNLLFIACAHLILLSANTVSSHDSRLVSISILCNCQNGRLPLRELKRKLISFPVRKEKSNANEAS